MVFLCKSLLRMMIPGAHTLLESELLRLKEGDLGLTGLALHDGLALHGDGLMHAILQRLHLLSASLGNCNQIRISVLCLMMTSYPLLPASHPCPAPHTAAEDSIPFLMVE